MSRSRKRGRKRSPAVKSPESAALMSQEAGLPAEGGGPVSRPAWAPGDVDLIKVPEPVRRAVAEIVEPAYRKLVAEVEDPLERSIGLTLVHLMWLEVLDQHQTKHEYLETSILELPEDRSGMIDRHLRMLNTKIKVGSFLMRLREMRRQAEAAAPQKVSGVRDQVSGMNPRLGGDTEGECGKPERCHPKNQLTVDSDQVSVRRWGAVVAAMRGPRLRVRAPLR